MRDHNLAIECPLTGENAPKLTCFLSEVDGIPFKGLNLEEAANIMQFVLPSAAPDRNQISEIGGGRALSAFSCQLLHKHCQHAFDLGDQELELFIVIEPDQLQIPTQEEMIFELAGRASGDTTEAGQLRISASPALQSGIGACKTGSGNPVWM
jgi:hypothetical protein